MKAMRGQTAERCRRSAMSPPSTETRPAWMRLAPAIRPKQGRLADAVGPDHADEAAARYRERDAVEGDRLAVAVREVRDRDDGIVTAGHWPGRREVGGPRDARVEADIGDAGQARAHLREVGAQERRDRRGPARGT